MIDFLTVFSGFYPVIVTITVLIFISFIIGICVFFKKINADKESFNLLNTGIADLTQEIKTTRKDFNNVQIKVSDLVFRDQLRENNTTLKEKLRQALESIHLSSDFIIKNSNYRRLMFDLIKAVAAFYTALRKQGKEIIEVEKIHEINGLLADLFRNYLFDENDIVHLQSDSLRILTDFNTLKNKHKKGETGYKSNSALIARKFKFFAVEIYKRFPNNNKTKKSNNMNIKGNKNAALQDLKAETININLPK